MAKTSPHPRRALDRSAKKGSPKVTVQRTGYTVYSSDMCFFMNPDLFESLGQELSRGSLILALLA